MTHTHHGGGNSKPVAYAIAAVIGLYIVALLFRWPQLGTKRIVEAEAHHTATADATPDDATPAQPPAIAAPPIWTVTPFVLLLAAIAVLPLIPATTQWWDSNSHRFLVAMVLAAVALAYYAFLHRTLLEGHWPAHHEVEPTGGLVQIDFVQTILENAILQEFIPFIVLLFSLFTISGGIRITGDLQAHPMTNATFMAVGALVASLVGDDMLTWYLQFY